MFVPFDDNECIVYNIMQQSPPSCNKEQQHMLKVDIGCVPLTVGKYIDHLFVDITTALENIENQDHRQPGLLLEDLKTNMACLC